MNTDQTSSQRSESIASNVAGFLGRYRTGLTIGGIALVAAIVGIVVVSQISDRRTIASVQAAEQIQQLWVTYEERAQSEAEDAETQLNAAETALREVITDTLADHGRSYGGLRAWHTLAQLEWEREDWAAAQASFLALVDAFPESHLAGPALAGAAAAAEELADIATARELYGRIAASEGLQTVERARALFNLGRLAEDSSELELAREYYDRLVDEHPGSNWTNLGRNRIIFLTSQGVGSDG